MPVAFGTVFKCGECGQPGHTVSGCPVLIEREFSVGTLIGEHSTVVSVDVKSVRLRCQCGVEFSRRPSILRRQEREYWRVTCGRWRCKCTRRPTDKQYVSARERILNGW